MMIDCATTRRNIVKNPVTPLPMDMDEKFLNSNGGYHDESFYLTNLSPPPPPQGRRNDDTERTITANSNPFSNQLLVFPSLSESNLKVADGGHLFRTPPSFKLQPRRGGLPPLHEGFSK
ncbi:hypothetical protein IV203_003217 [Nitzschia inconspicua]|uniref:Uncharacterized protein n=1 Tax=Nitzschia inconspicua TaxID=303405 RepID=A0A9K3PNG2_9STRA|nr:hypothetical protein IV203_003217 [Nitzschia inconspicua]